MIVPLTPGNQTKLIRDDIKHWQERQGKPHYGLIAHLLIISERLDAIELAAQPKEPRP